MASDREPPCKNASMDETGASLNGSSELVSITGSGTGTDPDHDHSTSVDPVKPSGTIPNGSSSGETTSGKWLSWARPSEESSGVYARLSTVTESDQELLRTIAKDVPRSFGGRAVSEEQREALTEVLLAFSKYDMGEGYTQGMGFIAAFALDQQHEYGPQARENVFWLMVEAFHRLPSGFFYRAAQDEISVFQAIVSKYLYEVDVHLGDDLYPAICYLVPRWFLSLFVFCMPDSVTLRLWNEVFFVDKGSTQEAEEDQITDASESIHSANDYQFILAYRLHCVALALLILYAPALIKQERIVRQALDRISTAQTGSAAEAELLNQRDARVGFEFMQVIVEAILEDKSNASKVIQMAASSPLSLEEFRDIRANTVAHLIQFRRQVKLVIRLQRWYRAFRVRTDARKAKEHARLELSCLACFGVSRQEAQTVCIQQ